jgi:predicted KAP-like P-loop ATPase
MSLEAIQQSAKTIVESAYDYETALQRKDDKKTKQTRDYMLKICDNIKRLILEEKKNV